MPQAIPAVIGGGLSLLGGRQQRRAQERALRQATTELQPFTTQGPGGIGTLLNPFTGQVNIGLGQLQPAFEGLTGLATRQLGRTGVAPGTLFPALQTSQQFAGLARQGIDPALGGLSALETGAGQVLGGSLGQFGDRLSQGFQQGLTGEAFGAAGQQLADASVTGSEARQQTLDQLRAQALPEQERATSRLLTDLFGTGRLGTTGGANIVGRLAEAQNQQDLGFQLAAGAEGRAAQAQAAGLASQFAGLGSGLAGQQEALLQGAFGRFGQTANLAADLNERRFRRGLESTGLQAGLLQQLFQQQTGIAGQEQALRGGELGLALQALQGAGGLQQLGLDQFGAGLAAAQAQANARIGAGSNIAQIASNPNFGASPLSTLGGALVENTQGISDFFGRIFRGNESSTTSRPVTGPIF